MNARELREILNKRPELSEKVIGILSTDRLLRNAKSCCWKEDRALIVNTTTSSHKHFGEETTIPPPGHWVAFHFGKEKNFFFCSGGLPPQRYNREYLGILGDDFECNSTRLQKPNDVINCGLYCLMFLYYSLSGYDFKTSVGFIDNCKDNIDLEVDICYKLLS